MNLRNPGQDLRSHTLAPHSFQPRNTSMSPLEPEDGGPSMITDPQRMKHLCSETRDGNRGTPEEDTQT